MSGFIKIKQLKSNNEQYGVPLVTDGIGGFTYDSGLTSAAISASIVQPWVDINRCGFVDNSQTTISFNDSTYIFTLSGLTTWSYYRRGIKYNISGNKTITLPSTTGTYYITINSTDGTLQYSTAVWTLKDYTLPVAVIRLNINNTPKYHLSDERHTIAIDRRLHLYLHQTRGTQFVDGGVLDGPSLNTATDAGTTFGISLTTIADEDLYEDLSPLVRPSGTTLVYNIYYRINTTTWSWSPSEVPFLYSPTYILWDNNGTMTTGIHSSYYNTYLLYTNQNGSARYSIVHGRGRYSSLTSAQSESPLTFDWSGFPVEESVIAYQFTWATSNSYSNKGKCRLEGSKLINVATIRTATSSGGIDHNSLSGLQGGLPTERYHLSGVEYSITVAMSSVVSSEISSRVSGDLSLSTALSSEISSTNSDVNSLSSAISLEVSSRTSGDLSLSTALSTTNSTRSSVDTSLSSAISTRISVDSSLSTSLNTEISQRISADASILAAIPSNNLSGLTSVNDTFLGYQAGLNSISNNNTFIGVRTGLSNTTGSANTFVGHNAGRYNTSGQCNIFIGYLAGLNNTEGFDNMYVGYAAGASLVNGSFNTYIGRSAGSSIIDATADTIIGSYTGDNLISSGGNVIIGHSSAGLSTESYGNVYIGMRAGYSNNGNNNIFLGSNAGASGYTSINNSIFIGVKAGEKETGSYTFLLDNIERVNEIEGRNKALMYGKFDTLLTNQFLRINGKFFVNGLTSGKTSNSVYYDSTTNEFLYDVVSGGDSYWQKSGTNVYIIDDNISVGTSTPSHKFTIGGTQSKSGSFENLLSINSNDATNQLRLKIGLINNATATSRGAVIQSVEEGVAYRNLLLNPDGGNVGIGTTTPDYILDLEKAGEVTLRLNNITSTTSTLIGADGVGSYIIVGNDKPLSIYTYGGGFSEKIRVNSNGSVGIGTTSPSYNFDSALSTASLGNKALIVGGGNEIWSQSQTNSNAALYINYRGYADGFTQFRDLHIANGKGTIIASFIGANNNVGIGTNSPNKKLEVNTLHTINIDDEIRIGSKYNNAFYGIGLNYQISSAGSPSQHIVSYNNNGKTTNISLDANGNVGINATNPIAKLQVNGLIAAYRYSSASNLPAITMDKPGGYLYGIGPDGTSMRVRYGATTNLAGESWVDNGGIEHYFDGHIKLPNGLLQLNKANTGSNAYHELNRDTIGTENMFVWKTAGTAKWYLGQRGSYGEDGFSLFNVALDSDNMYFSPNGELYLNGITNKAEYHVLMYNYTSKKVSYSPASSLTVSNTTYLNDKPQSFYNTEYVNLKSSASITVDCSSYNNFILSTSLNSFTLTLTNTVSGQHGTIILDILSSSTTVTISNTPTAYKSGTFTSLGAGKQLIEWWAYSSYIFYRITSF